MGDTTIAEANHDREERLSGGERSPNCMLEVKPEAAVSTAEAQSTGHPNEDESEGGSILLRQDERKRKRISEDPEARPATSLLSENDPQAPHPEISPSFQDAQKLHLETGLFQECELGHKKQRVTTLDQGKVYTNGDRRAPTQQSTKSPQHRTSNAAPSPAALPKGLSSPGSPENSDEDSPSVGARTAPTFEDQDHLIVPPVSMVPVVHVEAGSEDTALKHLSPQSSELATSVVAATTTHDDAGMPFSITTHDGIAALDQGHDQRDQQHASCRSPSIKGPHYPDADNLGIEPDEDGAPLWGGLDDGQHAPHLGVSCSAAHDDAALQLGHAYPMAATMNQNVEQARGAAAPAIGGTSAKDEDVDPPPLDSPLLRSTLDRAPEDTQQRLVMSDGVDNQDADTAQKQEVALEPTHQGKGWQSCLYEYQGDSRFGRLYNLGWDETRALCGELSKAIPMLEKRDNAESTAYVKFILSYLRFNQISQDIIEELKLLEILEYLAKVEDPTIARSAIKLLQLPSWTSSKGNEKLPLDSALETNNTRNINDAINGMPG